MFNLDRSIREWKRSIRATGNFEDGEAEELESHLRDAVEKFRMEGLPKDKAYEKAVREIGAVEVLAEAHAHSHERKTWRTTRKILPGLLVNYLKVAVRGLRRDQSYNLINIAGLAIGLSASLFIAYYALFELSYDSAYADSNIYHVYNQTVSSTGTTTKDAGGPVPLGTALTEEFPEIIRATRFWKAYMPTVRNGQKIFQEKSFMVADTNVLTMFHFAMVKNQSAHAFRQPNAILLSESMATKYFGADDPIGKPLEYDGYPGGKRTFLVAGVFKNLSANTHFSFDFLASFQAIEDGTEGWGSFKPVWTYLQLNSPEAADALEKKLPGFAKKYLHDRQDQSKLTFGLEPISSLYLHSHCDNTMKPGGNLALIQILAMTGLLILVMSCANFINIALARAMVKLKDSGVRKVLGASGRQLLTQHIAEVTVSLAIALVAAFLLIYLVAPVFSDLSHLPFQSSFLAEPMFLLCLGLMVAMIIVLTGFLPARVVWGFSIVNSLRTKLFSSKQQAFGIRNLLMNFQFIISGILMMSLLVVDDQLKFILQKDTGVTLTNVMAIPFSENPDVFENKVRALPGVESVAYSQRLPVNDLNYDGRIVSIPGRPDVTQVQSCCVSSDFMDTYQIGLLAGRNLNTQSPADSNKFLLNETAMKALGLNLKNVIGQPLIWSETVKGEVVGVVKDFQLESVHSKIPPMILLSALHKDDYERNFISIRMQSTDRQTAERIRELWREINPSKAYYQVSMPESYEHLHDTDITFGRIVFWFTIIALFISAIGLYATASFMAEQRKKEIGIRKVLGSKVIGIVFLIVRPFLKAALLTSLMVVPLVVYLMGRWLDTFAYHTSLNWTTLVLGGLMILTTTLLSTLKVTLGAATVNPVKYLRSE